MGRTIAAETLLLAAIVMGAAGLEPGLDGQLFDSTIAHELGHFVED